MPNPPKTYNEEYKREAVRLAKERGNIAQTARDLGVSDTSIITWRKQLQETPERPLRRLLPDGQSLA
jgi:transposase-like protein